MQRAFILLTLIGAGASACGQGYVRFVNGPSTLITTNSVIGGPSTAPISGDGGFYFALFMASPGTLDPNTFSFTGAYATNRLSDMPGMFNGGNVLVPSLSPLSFIVRGWSANIGPNHSDFSSYLLNPTFDAWYGESQIATTFPLSAGFPPGPIFGSAPGLIPGFNLNMYSAVPEPSSVVLGLLGGAALFFFRRRARGR